MASKVIILAEKTERELRLEKRRQYERDHRDHVNAERKMRRDFVKVVPLGDRAVERDKEFAEKNRLNNVGNVIIHKCL